MSMVSGSEPGGVVDVSDNEEGGKMRTFQPEQDSLWRVMSERETRTETGTALSLG